jgi:hypothetical protein
VADDPASEALPPRFFQGVLAAGVAVAGVAVAAAAMIGQPLWWWGDLFFPYPLIALVAAPLLARIAARLRRAPHGSRDERLFPWSWVVARFAILAGAIYLMVMWVVAALIGASVAGILVKAFLLAAMAHIAFFVAAQCAIDIARAFRGPAKDGS